MKLEKIIIIVLVVAAVGALVWTVSSFISSRPADTGAISHERYEKAVADELPDKCQTPDGYTDADWQDHMSHHPDRYQECLTALLQATPQYRNVTAAELASIQDNDQIVLIDTHIPEQEHIPGTDAFIPYDEIESGLAQLPIDKNTPIVLYCRSGNMSKTASQALVDQGYTNVFNLEGGTEAWIAAGYPVEEITS